jgi:hypothetical protein
LDKKTALTTKFVVVFFLFVLVLPISSCFGWYEPPYDRPRLSTAITSPIEGATYASANVVIKLDFPNTGLWAGVDTVRVSGILDGQICRQLPTEEVSMVDVDNGWMNLTGLRAGWHTLELSVHVHCFVLPCCRYDADLDPAVTHFFIYNSGVAPKVSVESLTDYEPNQVMMNITTDNPESIVSYELDGQITVTLPSNQSLKQQNCYLYNLTLPTLTSGSHTITVHAEDSFANTGTAKTSFTITEDSQKVTQGSFAINVIAGAAIATVIMASAVILILARKKK